MSFEQRRLSRTVPLVSRFIEHRVPYRMWHIYCIWQIRNNIIQHNFRDFLVFTDNYSLQSYFSRYFSMIYSTVKLAIENCQFDATILILKFASIDYSLFKIILSPSPNSFHRLGLLDIVQLAFRPDQTNLLDTVFKNELLVILD